MADEELNDSPESGAESKPANEPTGEPYKVGYRKPPKHTQFKPGRSGNPRGRSKGTKNLKTDLIEVLGEKVLVREGDRQVWVSKQRAAVMTLVAKTLKGDGRAAGHLIALMMRLTDTGEGASPLDQPLDENELEILRAYEMQFKQKEARDAETASTLTPDDDQGDPK